MWGCVTENYSIRVRRNGVCDANIEVIPISDICKQPISSYYIYSWRPNCTITDCCNLWNCDWTKCISDNFVANKTMTIVVLCCQLEEKRGYIFWKKFFFKGQRSPKHSFRQQHYLVMYIVTKSCSLFKYGSVCSSVGIATGYGLDDWWVGVRVPVGSRIFSSSRRPDRLCGSPNLLSKGYRGSFPGIKRSGLEADHSPPTSAEIKKKWIYTSAPPYAFMAWCLICWAQGQLYLFLPLVRVFKYKCNLSTSNVYDEVWSEKFPVKFQRALYKCDGQREIITRTQTTPHSKTIYVRATGS
jgi:hypothetical protein